jgi:hypothetical protein
MNELSWRRSLARIRASTDDPIERYALSRTLFNLPWEKSIKKIALPSVEEGVVHTFGCEDLTYSLAASDRAPFLSQS